MQKRMQQPCYHPMTSQADACSSVVSISYQIYLYSSYFVFDQRFSNGQLKIRNKNFSEKKQNYKKVFPPKINQTKKMGDDPNSLRPNIIDLIVLPNKLDCLTVENITTPAL